MSSVSIDGVVSGVEVAKAVIPFLRFPGETSYTHGSAPTFITADEVSSQRTTGIKLHV